MFLVLGSSPTVGSLHPEMIWRYELLPQVRSKLSSLRRKIGFRVEDRAYAMSVSQSFSNRPTPDFQVLNSLFVHILRDTYPRLVNLLRESSVNSGDSPRDVCDLKKFTSSSMEFMTLRSFHWMAVYHWAYTEFAANVARIKDETKKK